MAQERSTVEFYGIHRLNMEQVEKHFEESGVEPGKKAKWLLTQLKKIITRNQNPNHPRGVGILPLENGNYILLFRGYTHHIEANWFEAADKIADEKAQKIMAKDTFLDVKSCLIRKRKKLNTGMVEAMLEGIL